MGYTRQNEPRNLWNSLSRVQYLSNVLSVFSPLLLAHPTHSVLVYSERVSPRIILTRMHNACPVIIDRPIPTIDAARATIDR